jgi:hypothetical protein
MGNCEGVLYWDGPPNKRIWNIVSEEAKKRGLGDFDNVVNTYSDKYPNTFPVAITGWSIPFNGGQKASLLKIENFLIKAQNDVRMMGRNATYKVEFLPL